MTHDLESFVGEHKHDVFGEVSISLQQDGEGLYMNLWTLEGKLEHYHFDSFAASLEDFGVKFAEGSVTFVSGESGDVAGLMVEFDGDAVEFEEKKEPSDNSEKTEKDRAEDIEV
ncbi:hypothetical protein EDD21DRAFT_428544 [Dissophora ornata]|nr:hypothetical protein BGZ58_004400 [Dissophora ornata]KAI8601814.1 hypothetical protein EDD21DRAFT_428544 [Dissophora ornata]